MPNKTLLLTATALTILGAIYIFHTPSSSASSSTILTSPPNPNPKTMPPTPEIPDLQFHLTQTSRSSPPSLLVTLKNTSPDKTYTLLKWGTPLDTHAPNTGVFKVIDADTAEQFPTDLLKVGRKMPPAEGDVVSIAAGAEQSTEVVFDQPWMPAKRPARYRVWVEGRFTGLWGKDKAEVREEEVLAYTESEGWGRAFGSEEVVMVVE